MDINDVFMMMLRICDDDDMLRIIVLLLLNFKYFYISFNIDRMKFLKNAKCIKFNAVFNPDIIVFIKPIIR